MQIKELEKNNERISEKLEKLGIEKKALELEANRLQGEEKNKRALNVRIIDLEEELKKAMDLNNSLNDKLKLQEDKIRDGRSAHGNLESQINELNKGIKESESKRKLLEAQLEQ